MRPDRGRVLHGPAWDGSDADRPVRAVLDDLALDGWDAERPARAPWRAGPAGISSVDDDARPANTASARPVLRRELQRAQGRWLGRARAVRDGVRAGAARAATRARARVFRI